MKSSLNRFFNRIIAIVVFNLLALSSFAQDKGIDIDINVKKENEWYQKPWVWVIGGAVFILLLVALLRGNRGSKA
jgi:hypothetical protein